MERSVVYERGNIIPTNPLWKFIFIHLETTLSKDKIVRMRSHFNFRGFKPDPSPVEIFNSIGNSRRSVGGTIFFSGDGE